MEKDDIDVWKDMDENFENEEGKKDV